jgi:LacI family gluconate utilization system Gnt-I transcriptional repressor
MEDVAHHAQVSASSVSLYLRRPEAVSPRIAPRIAAAIEALNYVPNLVAGSLAAAHTRAVAVIVPSLINAFFSATVSAMQGELESSGYQLLLADSGYDPRKEERLVRTFLAWSPAAVVLTGLRHTATCRRMLKGAEVPVAEMWELGGKPFDMQVGFSHQAVGAVIAEHMLARGRSRLAVIGAYLDQDVRAEQRAQGFLEVVRRHGAQDATVISLPGLATPTSGAHGLRRLREQCPEVDGVFCSNDVLALGVLCEAQRLGISIPDQLAVAGFGDLPYAPVCVPPLTTVRPPSEAIGLTVTQRLLALKETRSYGCAPAEMVDLGFELVVRDSA